MRDYQKIEKNKKVVLLETKREPSSINYFGSNKNMKEVIASWSGGKDSCLATYRALQGGYKVSYLANTISKEYGRVRFHGLEDKVIQMQAQALGIPLLQKETTAEEYEKEFKANIKRVISDDINGIVFGDIHLRSCLAWANKVCKDLGVEAIEPLWGQEPEKIFLDFIKSGFKAVVVSTQADLLGKEWVGRKLDKLFLKDIKCLNNIDICGENGEYHSLVVDGPIFKKKIDIKEARKTLRAGYWFLDIRDYQLSKKNIRR